MVIWISLLAVNLLLIPQQDTANLSQKTQKSTERVPADPADLREDLSQNLQITTDNVSCDR